MNFKRSIALVATLVAVATAGLGATPTANAAAINYVNNQSMAHLSSVCAQSCFYASRTYNEVSRSSLFLWRLSGVQSGTGWSYNLDDSSVNPFHVTTSSTRWPLTASCQNRSGATRSSITCQTNF